MLEKFEAFLREKKSIFVFPLLGAGIFLILSLLILPEKCPLMAQILPFVSAVFGAMLFTFIRIIFLLWRGQERLFGKILHTLVLVIPFGIAGFVCMVMLAFSGDAC